MEVATGAIHADDAFFEEATSFDGLRFYRMREMPDEASKHQYISTGRADLSWGYGRHACPGRFFADIEIKAILSEFLVRYEIRNPEGQPRHANIEFESNVSLSALNPRTCPDISRSCRMRPKPSSFVLSLQ